VHTAPQAPIAEQVLSCAAVPAKRREAGQPPSPRLAAAAPSVSWDEDAPISTSSESSRVKSNASWLRVGRTLSSWEAGGIMSNIKRILVPTDFSTTSDLAVDYAIDLAKRYDGSLHLLHVVEDTYLAHAYPDGYFAELPGIYAKLRAEADQRLRERCARCAVEAVPVTGQIADGRPARVIVETATAMATDLIAMGTQGRSGVAHFIMGSVAERVVRTAPCPVLTVRDTARVADLIAAERRQASKVSA
jgi:universal stress protein A